MENDFGFVDPIEEGDELDLISHTNKTIIFSMYLKLVQFEHHIDVISTRYKYMALSWIFGIYAAIGFMMSTEVENLPFDPIFSVIMLCVIGVVGLSIIWHLDVNIYTKFWAVAFIEEIRMERKFKFLPRSRNLEFLIDDDRERIVSQGFLYMMSNCLFFITMIAASFFVFTSISLLFHFIVAAGIFFLNFLLCKFMHKISKKSQESFFDIVNGIKK